MNWGVVWAGGTAVVLGLVTNELFEWSPSPARRILRWAASWQAGDAEEAGLVYEEACEYLDAMPGRLSRVAWAIGRLRFGFAGAVRRVDVPTVLWVISMVITVQETRERARARRTPARNDS